MDVYSKGVDPVWDLIRAYCALETPHCRTSCEHRESLNVLCEEFTPVCEPRKE